MRGFRYRETVSLSGEIHASLQPGGELRPGDVLASKYRVERVLGSGGMGVVVAARHLQLDERVALKFLRTRNFATTGDVDRFLREARAAVKIKGEHVSRVYDVGTLEDGAPYIVMEYLEGEDLAAWLERRGPMPATQAVDFVLQACEAIAEAHSLGIVHRDLKPANLFCTERPDGQPSIKVLDFGISKIITPGAQGNDLTQTADLMGSPLYMSPEQLRAAKAVDSRTDIWSLGVILFQLVTGRAPFFADKVTELAIQIATEPTPRLRAFRPDAPAALEPVVARCLEKDRSSRFQSVGELAVALASLGSSQAQASVDRILGTLHKGGRPRDELPVSEPRREPNPSPAAMSATTAPASMPWGEPGTDRGRARGWKRAALVTTTLAALAGAAVLVFLRLGIPFARREPAPLDPRAQAADVAVPSASSSQPAAAASPQAPPVTASSLAPEAPPSASGTAPGTNGAAPRAPPRPLDHPPARVSPPRTEPPARPASTVQCDPPYTIDARGHHVPKPECL
jgi:serine/threonine-protein kinase